MPDPEPIQSADLDERLHQLLFGDPMPKGKRLLGLEFERLLLDEEGRSAPTSFSVELMQKLVAQLEAEPVVEGALVKGLSGESFDLSLEPGGQLEIAFPPLAKLGEVDEAMAEADAAIAQALGDSPYSLRALGCAPETKALDFVLLDRERYRIMDREMVRRGDLSQTMMRATAGFQITYDFADREDAAQKLAMLYRLSPVLLAVSANSSRCGGVDTGYASYRHHVWSRTDTDRSGTPDGCLDPETSLQGYVDFAKRATVLFQDRDGVVAESEHLSLAELVAKGGVTQADLELHLTSLFPHVRPRNYLEVRCFDALPWPESRSVVAFISGLVYCPHAFAAAFELSEPFAVRDETALAELHENAARHGLEAMGPDGRKLREVARQLVDISGATLGGPNCDWARTEDLEVVRARIEAPVRSGR